MNADVVVIGAGISGLAAAWSIVDARPDLRVVVLERDARVGGTARTESRDGYVVDLGPNAILSNVPETFALARAVGAMDALMEADASARKRYIFSGDRLRSVPLGLLHPSALGVAGILRAMTEPWRKPRVALDDELSVDAFFRDRFGDRAASLLAGPAVAGVSAGIPEETSVAALFPTLFEATVRSGSVLKGLRRNRGERARLVSFRGGMATLTDRIAARLGDRVKCNVNVVAVHAEAEGWSVETERGMWRSRALVLATSAPVAGRLLAAVDTELSRLLQGIPYAGMRVVTVGFRREDVPHPLDGFGYLVAPAAGLRTLGCVWASSAFPDRSPEGHVLMRVMMGGVRDPEIVAAPDAEASSVVLDELSQVLGITARPDFMHHQRWPAAIPQFVKGHRGRVAEIRGREAWLPGLRLCGNAYEGIAFNATLKNAMETGCSLAETL